MTFLLYNYQTISAMFPRTFSLTQTFISCFPSCLSYRIILGATSATPGPHIVDAPMVIKFTNLGVLAARLASRVTTIPRQPFRAER